jgi:competence protein ComEA
MEIHNMFKRLLAALFALVAATAFAAVDVNKATQAELDGIKGIGPAIAGKILDERKKGNFKDWSDFVTRVQGVGEGNAAKFSAEGLTVNGAAFSGAAPAAKAAKAEKPAKAAKADDKASAAAPKADDKAAKNAAKAEKAAAAASAKK